MAIKYVIPNKTIVLLQNSSTDDIIGIGIAELPDPRRPETQVQHWFMLVTDLENRSIPKQQAKFIVPSETTWDEEKVAPHKEAWKDIRTIADFLRKARDPGVFTEGVNLYIVANCEHYTTASLPAELPLPDFPLGAPSGHQAYWGIAPIMSQKVVDTTVGILFAREDGTNHVTEYWALGERYQEPALDNYTVVAETNRMKGNDFKNIITGATWKGNATLAVAACTIYAEVP